MSDDSDFTAPCIVVNEIGSRCIVQSWFLNDEEQPHDHRYPPVPMTTPTQPEQQYTPSAEDIRDSYLSWNHTTIPEFDRWLAAHDAQVREEGATAVVDYYENETVGVAAFRWSATKTHFALPVAAPTTGAENTDSDEKEKTE